MPVCIPFAQDGDEPEDADLEAETMCVGGEQAFTGQLAGAIK
jgi:hypothetical protein